MPVSSWQGSPFCLLVSPSTAPVVDPLGQASHGDTGRRLPAVFLNISPLLPCVHLPSPALKVRAACGRIPQRPVPHHHSYLLPQPRMGCKGVREGVAEVCQMCRLRSVGEPPGKRLGALEAARPAV